MSRWLGSVIESLKKKHYGILYIPQKQWLRTNGGIFWTTSAIVAQVMLDSLISGDPKNYSVRQFDNKININKGGNCDDTGHNGNPESIS